MVEEADGHGRARWWVRWRVVLYLLLGLAGLDVVVAAYRDVWNEFEPESYQTRLRACRRQAHDLVVVGGSPTMYGIDPGALTGISWHGRPLASAYNLGLALATSSEVWLAVEHGLAAPPRLLVYGIAITDLNEERVVPQGPRDLMDLRDLGRWVRGRPETALWCLRQALKDRPARLWKLYYHREGIRLWAAHHLNRLLPGLCPQAAAEAADRLHYAAELRRGHGFIAPPYSPRHRLDCLKQAGAKEATFFPWLDNYRLGEHLADLHRLLDWTAGNGVPLVLVDMPVSADLEERLHPREFASYRRLLADLERSRKVRVLRPSRREVGLTNADFADLIHLNDRGAARLSRWLRGALARLGK
jgi:hypothetical protein